MKHEFYEHCSRPISDQSHVTYTGMFLGHEEKHKNGLARLTACPAGR